jgi:hypothetical protein
MGTPANANKSAPVYKDPIINVSCMPNEASGQFIALYTSSNGSDELVFLNNSSLNYVNEIKATSFSDSHFTDLEYWASINNYIPPNKSIKEPLSGILSFFEAKNITPKLFYSLAEGGFVFDFKHKNIRYIIEVYNDNEDVLTVEESGQPIKAWDLNHPKLLKKMNSIL